MFTCEENKCSHVEKKMFTCEEKNVPMLKRKCLHVKNECSHVKKKMFPCWKENVYMWKMNVHKWRKKCSHVEKKMFTSEKWMFPWEEEKNVKTNTSKTGRDSDRPPSQRDQRISNQFIESVVVKLMTGGIVKTYVLSLSYTSLYYTTL